VSEKTKFDKDSLGRLSKNQAKHLIWIVIYCLAKIYVEYFEKLIQGRNTGITSILPESSSICNTGTDTGKY